MTAYDILLKNATVVDPASGRVEGCGPRRGGGQIADIGPDLDPTQAREVFDLRGCHLLPASWICTCTPRPGSGARRPQDDGRGRRDHRPGHVGAHRQRPGHRPGPRRRSEHRLHRAVRPGRACKPRIRARRNSGAPRREPAQGRHRREAPRRALSAHPEATARTIELANEARAYVALHAGSATQGSNIEGSCRPWSWRGTRSPHRPREQLLPRRRPRLHAGDGRGHRRADGAPEPGSESYLSPLNGTSATCSAGAPESRVTQHCLTVGDSADGGRLRGGHLAGWAQINVEAGGRVVLGTGPAARDYWRQRNTDATVSFAVTRRSPGYAWPRPSARRASSPWTRSAPTAAASRATSSWRWVWPW